MGTSNQAYYERLEDILEKYHREIALAPNREARNMIRNRAVKLVTELCQDQYETNQSERKVT